MLKSLAHTVLAAFGATLILSFTHTFANMANPGSEPSVINPLAFGFRVLAGLELGAALAVVLAASVVLYLAGTVLFVKRDI